MPRGWEGNRRSGIALAMHHGLKWFIHLRAQRPRVGDEHPTYAPAGAWFPLTLISVVSSVCHTQICVSCLNCLMDLGAIQQEHFEAIENWQ